MDITLKGLFVVSMLVFAATTAFIRIYRRRRHYLRLHSVLNLTLSKEKLALTRYEMISERLVGWCHSEQVLLVVERHDIAPLMISLKAADKCYVIKKADRKTVKVIRLLFATRHNRVVYDLFLYKQGRDSNPRKIEKQCRNWHELLNSHLVK